MDQSVPPFFSGNFTPVFRFPFWNFSQIFGNMHQNRARGPPRAGGPTARFWCILPNTWISPRRGAEAVVLGVSQPAVCRHAGWSECAQQYSSYRARPTTLRVGTQFVLAREVSASCIRTLSSRFAVVCKEYALWDVQKVRDLAYEFPTPKTVEMAS